MATCWSMAIATMTAKMMATKRIPINFVAIVDVAVIVYGHYCYGLYLSHVIQYVRVSAVPMYVVRWSTESCNGSADRRKRRQHCHVSEMTDYPRAKKSDDHHASSLLLTLKRPLLVTGDVIVELFNKPKMMKKVERDV